MPRDDGEEREAKTDAVARFAETFKQPVVREEIQRLVDALGSSRASGEMSVHLLRPHRRRCTFEVAVETDDGTRSMIAKVYKDDRSDIYGAMRSIVQAGFGPTAEFGISVPLAYLPAAHLLLEEKVPGTQAKRYFVDHDRDSQVAAARRCGSWLAQFHARAPRLGRTETPELIVEQIRHWAHHIQGAGDALADKARSLLRLLEDAAPSADGFEPRAGHGSYMPEHVILSDERAVTIDFDDLVVADPAHDVAWFLVYLTVHGLKHRGSLRAHERSTDAFLRAYAASGPRDALAQLPFYRAAECMHWASLYVTKQVLDAPAIMIEEGIAALGSALV